MLRRDYRWGLALVAALCASVQAVSAPAQNRARPPRPVLIRGGTLLTLSDRGTLEGGTLLLRRGNIAAVREGTRRGARNLERIDATGRFVTPGLIDAWSSIGLDAGGRPQSGQATHRALDGLDAFDRHVFEEALRHGVTAICLEPAARRGFVGTAALLRLENLDALRAGAVEDVCLVARVGLGEVGPIARLGEIKALRTALREARDYREAWDDYREELAEYVKKLEAGQSVKLKKPERRRARPAPRETPRRRRRPGRRRRRPRPRPRDTDPAAFFEWLRRPDAFARSARESGLTTCPDHPWIAYAGVCPEDHEGDPTDDEHDRLDPSDRPEPFADEPEKPADAESKKKKDKKDDEELTKPEEPARDPVKEVLVRALKRTLPVRFEAHRPADIANVLALIEEFNLDATLSGASGAAWLTEELARAEVPVILGRMIPSGLYDKSHTRDLRPDIAARLAAAGIPPAIGGGGPASGAATHYLAQKAALAVGYGLDPEIALEAITRRAARLCGAADRIGRLEPGMVADVVIWTDHPLAPDARVERVFVGGREVYRLEE